MYRSLAFAFLILAVLPPSAGAKGGPVRTVALDGIEMAYRDVGAGEPLVLLHGFGGCAADGKPFVERHQLPGAAERTPARLRDSG